jgi:DamX protein
MAEAERTFLGMTHNPFREPAAGFFEQGGRKTHLERLRHLSQWSRRVLLVTGPEDAGKTSLYRQLAATLEPGVTAARINASLVNSGREVLAAVASGFGLFVTANANTQGLRHLLLGHVEQQSSRDRLCLALVDDAHLLDNKAVDELIRLASESAMHLVLFGEVRMVPVVERAASARGVGWQEIRLTGYGDADARDYLEWRFRQARYRGRVPFTDHEVKEMVRQSQGLPGRMNRMANVLLARLESGGARPARPGFPRLHVAILALVVTATGLLYVILSGRESMSEAPSAMELAREAVSATDATTIREPDLSATSDELGLADEPASVEDTASAEAVVSASGTAVADPPMAESPEPVAVGSPAGVEAPIDDGSGVSATGGPSEAIVANVTTPETTAPAVVVVEPQTPAEEAPAAEPVVEAPSEVAGERQATPADAADRGRSDVAWLLAQDPNAFTLQLVTVSTLASAKAFVEKQQVPEEFAIYPLNRDGRTLHVVLYGLYSTRQAAQMAADRLPPEVGDIQPWIRPLEQVQATARLSLRQ